MKSKKADIPITVLVALTIAICIFTLISFYFAGEKIKSKLEKCNFLGHIYLDSNNQEFITGKAKPVFEENSGKEGIIFKKEVLFYQVNYNPG